MEPYFKEGKREITWQHVLPLEMVQKKEERTKLLVLIYKENAMYCVDISAGEREKEAVPLQVTNSATFRPTHQRTSGKFVSLLT